MARKYGFGNIPMKGRSQSSFLKPQKRCELCRKLVPNATEGRKYCGPCGKKLNKSQKKDIKD